MSRQRKLWGARGSARDVDSEEGDASKYVERLRRRDLKNKNSVNT